MLLELHLAHYIHQPILKLRISNFHEFLLIKLIIRKSNSKKQFVKLSVIKCKKLVKIRIDKYFRIFCWIQDIVEKHFYIHLMHHEFREVCKYMCISLYVKDTQRKQDILMKIKTTVCTYFVLHQKWGQNGGVATIERKCILIFVHTNVSLVLDFSGT